MKAALYARVSTNDGRQTTQNQIIEQAEFCARRSWEVVATFQDEASGSQGGRSALRDLLAAAHRREFDSVVVWALDRFTREGVLKAFEYQARALREIAEHIQNLLLRPVAEPPADYSPLSTAPGAGSHRCLIFQDPGPPWYGAQCKRFAPHAGPCDFGTMEEAQSKFYGEARHKFAAPPGHFICVVCKRIKADPLHDPPEPGR